MSTIMLHPDEVTANRMEGDYKASVRIYLNEGESDLTAFLTDALAHKLVNDLEAILPPENPPQADAEAAAREVDGETEPNEVCKIYVVDWIALHRRVERLEDKIHAHCLGDASTVGEF